MRVESKVTVSDQRRSRRFDLSLPFELLRKGAQELLESGETMNVSSVGVLFRSSAHLEPGDIVEYRITLPSSFDKINVRLKCKGRVVRRSADSEAAVTMERWEFLRDGGPARL